MRVRSARANSRWPARTCSPECDQVVLVRLSRALLNLRSQIAEKFFEETLPPILRRLLMHDRLREAEIGRPRPLRDQRRACKRRQQNCGAGKRDDDFVRRRSVLEPSKHGADTVPPYG